MQSIMYIMRSLCTRNHNESVLPDFLRLRAISNPPHFWPDNLSLHRCCQQPSLSNHRTVQGKILRPRSHKNEATCDRYLMTHTIPSQKLCTNLRKFSSLSSLSQSCRYVRIWPKSISSSVIREPRTTRQGYSQVYPQLFSASAILVLRGTRSVPATAMSKQRAPPIRTWHTRPAERLQNTHSIGVLTKIKTFAIQKFVSLRSSAFYVTTTHLNPIWLLLYSTASKSKNNALQQFRTTSLTSSPATLSLRFEFLVLILQPISRCRLLRMARCLQNWTR